MSTDAQPADFREAVRRLHKEKDAAYRDAWKRRGEIISIIANIARKVDRLEYVVEGATPTQDESMLDTAIDLFVYALKYQTFLADQDASVASSLFRQAGVAPPYSDGVAGFEWLLARAEITPLERPQNQSLTQASENVFRAFAWIEEAFDEPLVSVIGRAERAAELTFTAIVLLGVLRRDAPEGYHDFLAKQL